MKNVLPYERLTDYISKAIHLWHGEHLLVRRPFRWHLDGKPVPNGYESFGATGIIDSLGMEVVENYGDHIFILRKKTEIGTITGADGA